MNAETNALDVVRQMVADGQISQDVAERYFPKLAESEDEKIIKEIIQFLILPHPQFVGKRDHEKWIAWLEKQEQISSAYDVCEVKGPDYEGLTDFEKALASACIGWMGKKPNWQHYIKESADILLKVAIKDEETAHEILHKQLIKLAEDYGKRESIKTDSTHNA